MSVKVHIYMPCPQAGYRCCVASSFLEKKPRGCHAAVADSRCWRAALMWAADASTMRAIAAPALGYVRWVALRSAAVAVWKASRRSLVHSTAALGFGEPFRASVSGKQDVGRSWHELPVEVDHPQEVLQLPDVGWAGMSGDDGHSVR